MLAITTKVFDTLMTAYTSKKYNVFVLEGGSRSSKTFSVIQFWINWAYEHRGQEKRVIVSRWKGTWLKATALKDFIDVLKSYGLYDKKNHNKSEGSGIYRLYDTEFWFLGLDDEQRIHGMRSDAFWINEAIEASFDDYAQLMQRCSGFAIIDYNPSEEEHWIYDKLCKRPKTFYSHSTMLDNRLIPANAKEQILSYEPTEANYAAGTVDKRKWEIYGLGKRAKIEGLVFEDFKVIRDIPAWVKRRYTGLDFGYTNDPTAISEVGIHDNSIYINELCYQTKMLVSDIIKKLKEVNGNRKIWSESADPRLIDEIYNAGFDIDAVDKGNRGADGSIKAGIDKMKSMHIFITENSLNAIKEFKNYTYDQDKEGKWLNKPIDNFNHCFVGGTLVETIEGLKEIKDLTTDDKVLTRMGYKSVNKLFVNGCKKICNYTLDFGIFAISIKCTPDHKILTENGWKEIQEITSKEMIYLSKNLRANSIIYTKAKSTFLKEPNDCIELYGNTTTEQYRKVGTFTTKTKTSTTTTYQTLSLSHPKSILLNTCRRLIKMIYEKGWIMQGYQQANGMEVKTAGNGTVNTQSSTHHSYMKERLKRPANVANNLLQQASLKRMRGFVPTSANQNGGESRELTTKKENAYYVNQNSLSINTQRQSFAQSIVLESITKECEAFENVYDIEVNEQHEYFANGILVHNCIDGVRYVILMELLGQYKNPKSAQTASKMFF